MMAETNWKLKNILPPPNASNDSNNPNLQLSSFTYKLLST